MFRYPPKKSGASKSTPAAKSQPPRRDYLYDSDDDDSKAIPKTTTPPKVKASAFLSRPYSPLPMARLSPSSYTRTPATATGSGSGSGFGAAAASASQPPIKRTPAKLNSSASRRAATAAVRDIFDSDMEFSPTNFALLAQKVAELTAEKTERDHAKQISLYIQNHPQLEIFSTHFKSKLSSVFAAFKVLSTNKIQHSSTGQSAAQGIGTGLNFLTLGISSIVTSIASSLYGKHETNKATNIADFLGITTHSDTAIEFVATHLALRF
jgi:hypothetical protein